MEREKFASRLGFVLISAGCAIGIGNVWRFPYITGQNGGGFFCAVLHILPGRSGNPHSDHGVFRGKSQPQKRCESLSAAGKTGAEMASHGIIAVAGNLLTDMFYTVVTGWMLHYFYLTASGRFVGSTTEEVERHF